MLLQNSQELGQFLSEHSKVPKICTLIGSLHEKYAMFDLKKSSGVIFHDTTERCKIWRKTDFCFKKSQEEFEKFSPEHLKISKLELWWDSFAQSWKCMSLRFTGKLCVMRMKNGPKIEELISQFKTDMNNLTNFDSSTQKSQKFAL